MVNVAGRSKGCSTCRRRRVKCDETRPACQRCQNRGLVCDGPKGTTFVEATIVKSRRTHNHVLTRTRNERIQSASALPNHQIPIAKHDISPKFNKHEIYICYMRRHLFSGGPIDLQLQDLQIGDITANSSNLKVADMPVFNQAFLSFATIFFGTNYHQPHILAQGYTMHGVALRNLNHTLSAPGCHVRDDIVVAVIVLAMLEATLPSGPNNYLKHMLGLERLLDLRGPASLANCSYRTSELYKGVRHMILFASLRNRSPSILAKPEWRVVLRTGLSLEEPEEQDLHDVLADCSVLIVATDELAAEGDGRTMEQLNDVEHKAKELLLSLKKWKQRWDDDVRNICFEEHQSQPSNLPHVPTIYRFGSASIARMFMLYNTALVYVLEVLASMTSSSSDGNDVSNATSQTNVWASVVDEDYHAARRLASFGIAGSITDYLDHLRITGNGQFVSLVVQWAFATALKALGGSQSVEGEWMMSLLDSAESQAFAKGAWEP